MARKGLIAAVTALAASPQGRRMLQQALHKGQAYMNSPEGKAKVAQLKEQAGRARKRP